MIGKKILHYNIIKKLGEGGMGVVYLAEDTKLERQVAIKFLPHHVAGDTDQYARFIVEAKAAAALNHPNIATIHAIEQAGDEMFIVMEFIEGVELKEKLKSGALDVDESLNIAQQIAHGLESAHEKNIIHRDIKSTNIMITEKGQVKIMDFGLAKMRGSVELTQEQSTLGTTAYMSPEQLRGESLDYRTDIWSFGVVLYEMLTGQLPFKGDYQQGVIYSVLNEEPDFIGFDLPESVQVILQKALQKNVQERFQSISILMDKLKMGQKVPLQADSWPEKINAVEKKKSLKIVLPVTLIIFITFFLSLWFYFKPDPIPVERISIAVADFENLTGEPELNALSGMLITALEQSKHLSVLTRSRVFDVLRQIEKEDVVHIDERIGAEICRNLNIRALALSTIRKFGNNYSIDLKIMDPINNEYLFTTRAEAESQEEIPTIIDQISDETREGLQEREADLIQNKQRVDIVITKNLEAYQHYFKGKEYLDKEKYRRAEAELNKAVDLDSSFGLAVYYLAVTKFRRGARGAEIENLIKKSMGLIETIPEREKYLVRARYNAMNDNYTEAISILQHMEEKYSEDKEMNTMLGRYAFQKGDYHLAQKYFEKVVKLDPGYKLVWEYWYGSLPAAYILSGEIEDGLAKLIKLKDQFPGVHIIVRNVADFFLYLDNYEAAELEYENILREEQSIESRMNTLFNLAFILPYRGKYKEAIKIFDRGIDLAKQAEDSSLVASMMTFKSITYIWGWDDAANAKNVAREAEKYLKHLNYPTTRSLLYFFQQNYDEALKIGQTYKFTRGLILSKQGSCDSLESAKKLYEENDQFMILMLYYIAECHAQRNNFTEAIDALKKLQNIYSNVAGFRAVYYPKSFYLLGKIFEMKGHKNLAAQNYRKFLELWKEADNDLPELIDTKQRLADLEVML